MYKTTTTANHHRLFLRGPCAFRLQSEPFSIESVMLHVQINKKSTNDIIPIRQCLRFELCNDLDRVPIVRMHLGSLHVRM